MTRTPVWKEMVVATAFRAWCGALPAARVVHSRSLDFAFLAWNLFLAAVPFALSLLMTLVVFYAVWRGSGHLLYEAMAREADAPHRAYFIVAPYLATLIGGLATNMLFGQAALVGYLVTGLGDAVGEPAGARFGRHPYRVPSVRGVAAVRTSEGSAAVLAACLVAVVLAVAFSPVLDWRRGSLAAVPALALACAAIEAVSPHGWDNAFMQILPTMLAVLLFGAQGGAV